MRGSTAGVCGRSTGSESSLLPLLFSYGTLRDAGVQRELFGRTVPSSPDALSGWVLKDVAISDPEVVRLSGQSVHRGLVSGEGPPVDGVVLALSDEQLAAADRYEARHYVRRQVQLASGRRAYAYVVRGL